MRVIVDIHAKNAECPAWNPIDQMLYWADIPAGRMYRYDPQTEHNELIHEAGQQIGALVVARDGSIVLGLEEGLLQSWRDGTIEVICPGIPEEKGRRFNDAQADPRGRVLIGTMPGDIPARLYLFDLDGSYRVLLDEVGESNGMGFGDEGRVLYHTDTGRRQVRRYAYDVDAGSLGQGETIFEITEPNAVPDGLALDAHGVIWSALWGGRRIVGYDVQGKEVQHFDLPVPKVSSLAFGGPLLDQLFITTAGGADRSSLGSRAGDLFAMPVPVVGSRRYLADIKAL